jgi:peptidoglycan hydrolase CwlO-like protein
MSKIKDMKHHNLDCALRYYKFQTNYAQNQIIQLKLDISKEIKHDKDLNVTAFNPYVNEWKAELKKYRKKIQEYTESIKQLKTEIKKNQRFMNDIFN